MQDEVLSFLDLQSQKELLEAMSSLVFWNSLAYLADIFELLNSLNTKLQGRNSTIIHLFDAISAFIAKLDLWKARVMEGNIACFNRLDESIQGKSLCYKLSQSIVSHLELLKNEFLKYFPDLEKRKKESKFIRNPFNIAMEDISEDMQEESIDLKNDSFAEDDFKNMELIDFWIKQRISYPKISNAAISVLINFGTTYLCELGFSTLVSIKTKYRNCLKVENDIRCALSSTTPRIEKLVAKKQHHSSH